MVHFDRDQQAIRLGNRDGDPGPQRDGVRSTALEQYSALVDVGSTQAG